MNVSNPKLLWQLTFEGAWPLSVAFLGNGRRLAAGNEAGQVFLWDLPETPPELPADKKTGERTAPDHPPRRRLDGHTNSVPRLVATPDGKALVSASFDRSVRIWDPDAPATGSAEAILDLDARKAEAKRSRKDDGLKAPGVMVETVAPVQTLDAHRDWVQTLALSSDGKRMITGDTTSQVIVWDLPERREVTRWKGYPWNWIVSAALSADGQTALVSEHRYKRDDFDVPTPALRFYEAATGTLKLDVLKTMFPKHKPEETGYGPSQIWRKFVAQGLIATAFSPDGSLVALGQGGETDTGKVHLVETATGKPLREVSGHLNGVTAVAFSADGQHVLSTGRDTVLRICQVADGKEVAVLGKGRGGQFKDWLTGFAVSPDETRIAATDASGLVHVWGVGS